MKAKIYNLKTWLFLLGTILLSQTIEAQDWQIKPGLAMKDKWDINVNAGMNSFYGDISSSEAKDSLSPSDGPATSDWIAYNDLAFTIGQLEGNVTKITSPTGGSGLPSSAQVVDYSNNATTGVTLTVSGGTFDGDGGVQGGHGGEPDAGTDAYTYFNGKLSCTGAISYIDQVDSNLVLTLTGMDPAKTYNMVFYPNRGSYGWDRASLVSISGADAFTNESSTGTDNNSDPLFSGSSDPSTRLPADNTATGYVARFTGIDPGSDGEVVLTISFDGTAPNKGKYASALMIEQLFSPLWTGAVSTDWSDEDNWYSGRLPSATSNVVVPSAPSGGNYIETSSGAGAECNDLTIESGAHLYVPANNTLTVNGTLINNAGA
ncbi:MAG: hypothetical protein K8S16_10410, partial [Bacteroidales bacterium]|nr:hypothetical protein [Bacteroidales bacterium]